MIECVNEGFNELDIKRSRFLAYSFRIDSRTDAASKVSAVRSEHPDARHVCHAFIADEKGDEFGYDDDGEPSGTAGKPIYSALENSGARKSLIVVVRYFGGIKLGAGGLARAYRQSAAELIKTAGLSGVRRAAVYSAECDGEAYKRGAAALRKLGCSAENIVYADGVTFTVTAPVEIDIISVLGALGVRVRKTGEKYIRYDIGEPK